VVQDPADWRYASYSRRLPDTQGGGGELVVGYNMSNMLGTKLYITPIQVVWPKLCRLQVFGADVHTLPGWSGS